MRPQCSFRSRAGGALPVAGLLLLASTAVASSAWGQTGPRILHEGLTCLVAGRHAIVDALVEPADDLVTVKAYFRAEIYPAFFYVEMEPLGGRFQAVLPRPSSDVESVVYYLEAVDSTFNSLRTEEFYPRVVTDPADCEGETPRTAYLDGPASITVGATAEGSSFPPGFLTEGIIATISALGRTAGGTGAGTLIGIGAAAGAATGVGVLVAGGDDDVATTTTSPILGTTTVAITTTAPPTSTVPPSSSLTACFDTEPNPPTIGVGGSVRFDASCSGPDRDDIARYDWDFHDGRGTREGRVVNRVYSDPGVFPAELTITDAAGNQARTRKDVTVEQAAPPPPGGPPPPGPTTTVPGSADLEVVSLGGPPNVAPGSNATYTVNYRNNGPDLDPTVTVVTTFNRSGGGGTPVAVSIPGCGSSSGPGSLTVSCPLGSIVSGGSGSKGLIVRFPSPDTYFISASISGGTTDSAPANNTKSRSTSVPLKAGPPVQATFVTEILSQGSFGIQASIELNGAETALSDDTGPRRHTMNVRHGRNVLLAQASGPHVEGALWRFDFAQTESFVSGSLTVESGDVVSLDSHSVVLRLSPGAARIRLRFTIDHRDSP